MGGIKLLASDSRHRKDIKLRGENLLKEAQEEKENIEQIERYYRKLRKGEKNITMEELNLVDKMEEADLNDNEN